jgi:hypothetical protein
MLSMYLSQHHMSQAVFEDKAGWNLDGFITNPNAAWDWNVDCLRDLCGQLGVDWLAALPG